MTADEIRADIHKLDEKVPPAALAVFQVATLGEIGAQLAQLNVTLERLARAVEQVVPPVPPVELLHCNECGEPHKESPCPYNDKDGLDYSSVR